MSSQCFCTSAFESHNLHTIHISVSQKKPDALNLSMSEVNVTGLQGDQSYQCVLEKIESKEIICKIKGGSGAITSVDSITVRLFINFLGEGSHSLTVKFHINLSKHYKIFYDKYYR